jgi:hypothetical protein
LRHAARSLLLCSQLSCPRAAQTIPLPPSASSELYYVICYSRGGQLRQRFFGTPRREKQRLNLQEPCVLQKGRARRYSPNTPSYVFFQQISVLNFLNMLHILRFFSLQNAVYFIMLLFCSCIIHILHTGCAKI